MKSGLGAALAVAFVAAGALAASAKTEDKPATIVTSPTLSQIAAAFPAQAKAENVPGAANVICKIGADSKAACEAVEETPAGKGFGEAAARLMEKNARFTAEEKDGAPIAQVIGPIKVIFTVKGVPDPQLSAVTLVRQPTPAQIDAAYPPKAKERKVDGAARLTCNVDEAGSMEKCFVAMEFPLKMGFGEAAQSLAMHYAVKPPTKDGKPTRSQISFPVGFGNAPAMAGGRGGGPRGGGPPGMAGRRGGPPGMPPMIPNALWDKAPTWAELVAANPNPAAAQIAMRCRITEDGRLRECAGTDPQGDKAIQNAAIKLADKFQVADDPAYKKQVAGSMIALSVNFPDKAKASEPRRLAKPEWKRVVDPKVAQSVFPAQATQAGLKSGRGVVECVVIAGGALDQCKVVSEDPVDMGFGAAALSISKAMAVNPWIAGEPAEGATVRLPIRVALPEEAPK